MSAEGATALYERVSSDEGFRGQLEAAKTPEGKHQIVTEAGYDVTPDDLPTLRSLAGMAELSDEDLEKVAGGDSSPTVASVVSAGYATLFAAAAAIV
jgi:predicted ribosomally synthesized peptide with nif11-like leader